MLTRLLLLMYAMAGVKADPVMSATPSGIKTRGVMSAEGEADRITSLPGLSDEDFPPSFYVSRPYFRSTVMEAIGEIISDLEDLHKNINDQATAHIHAGEVVLTYGRSKTVESVSILFKSYDRQHPIVATFIFVLFLT